MSLKSFIVIIGIALMVLQTVQSAAVQSIDDHECICTREYHPICASNGITYSNKCSYNCEKDRNKELSIKFEGECDEQEAELF